MSYFVICAHLSVRSRSPVENAHGCAMAPLVSVGGVTCLVAVDSAMDVQVREERVSEASELRTLLWLCSTFRLAVIGAVYAAPWSNDGLLAERRVRRTGPRRADSVVPGNLPKDQVSTEEVHSREFDARFNGWQQQWNPQRHRLGILVEQQAGSRWRQRTSVPSVCRAPAFA